MSPSTRSVLSVSVPFIRSLHNVTVARQIPLCVHFSTKSKSKTKSKPKSPTKYNAKTYSKPNAKSSKSTNNASEHNPMYEAPSLSSFENSESSRSGWSGVFQRCYTLLGHNPYGITTMMHSFNTITTTTGVVVFGSIYYCSLYSIYSFPSSWFFSWFALRLFTDIFPIFHAVYCRLIDGYVLEQFPVLKYLRFSRKLPNPELQSMSSMLKDRMHKTQELKRKTNAMKRNRGKSVAEEEEEEEDLDDVVITDEQLAKSSVMANWKVRQRSGAKKYGLAWDMVENTSTLVVMPMFMVMFHVIGIGDPLIEVLLQNDNVISNFLARNEWIIQFGSSYAVSTYLTRLMAVPIFRFWSVPRAFDAYGPIH